MVKSMPPVIDSALNPKSNPIPLSSAERLKKCFDLAPPGILYNWHEEVLAVQRRILSSDVVLDIGSGYGRIIPELARSSKFVIGIDPVRDNIRHGREWLKGIHNCLQLEMNPESMSFADSFFTKAICIQNNMILLGADPLRIIKECLRVIKKNHELIITVYNEKSWDNHFAWYEIQSRLGLIGDIDYKHTRPGQLAFRDGKIFQTITHEQYLSWTTKLNATMSIEPITEHFSFCVIRK